MAHVAFIVSVPRYRSAALGTPNITIGEELAQKIARDLPLSTGVRFVSATASDHTLQAVTNDSLVNPTSANFTRTSAAGGAAGDITVTGILATDVLVAVVGVKDADQSVLDLTSEFSAAAGKINNTGGTATTGYHLVIVYYRPAASILAPTG